jgi:hypothetical protein
MRMIAVCLAVLCLAVVLLPGGDNAVSAQVSQKPNVLFILTDDQERDSANFSCIEFSEVQISPK